MLKRMPAGAMLATQTPPPTLLAAHARSWLGSASASSAKHSMFLLRRLPLMASMAMATLKSNLAHSSDRAADLELTRAGPALLSPTRVSIIFFCFCGALCSRCAARHAIWNFTDQPRRDLASDLDTHAFSSCANRISKHETLTATAPAAPAPTPTSDLARMCGPCSG